MDNENSPDPAKVEPHWEAVVMLQWIRKTLKF